MSTYLKRATNFVLDLMRKNCPECESAYTGGHPDPDHRAWCLLCSDPQTGEMRGWIWKWTWVNRLFTTRHNFALVDLAHRLELLQQAYRTASRGSTSRR